jgi:hypothetical protein
MVLIGREEQSQRAVQRSVTEAVAADDDLLRAGVGKVAGKLVVVRGERFEQRGAVLRVTEDDLRQLAVVLTRGPDVSAAGAAVGSHYAQRFSNSGGREPSQARSCSWSLPRSSG